MLGLFLISSVSAYSYHDSTYALNKYSTDRVVHNRVSDYFRYGSYWQGDVVYDFTYSQPYVGYRYVESPYNYYRDYAYGNAWDNSYRYSNWNNQRVWNSGYINYGYPGYNDCWDNTYSNCYF